MDKPAFECDAVKREGVVLYDVTCCSTCHKGHDEAPFIIVGHRRRVVCCAIASAYNIEVEQRQWGRIHE